VRLTLLQRGQDHRFEMATQFVAVDRLHAFIIDRLGITVNGDSVPVARKDRCDHRRRNWQPDLKDTIHGRDVRRATGGLRSSELSYFG
jgi:hypothetical protein